MKKFLIYFLSIIIINSIFINRSLAVCPLCTVTVGAGVGLSRWLGIDDSITGLWIGGLIVSMITWTDDWFKRKKINFKGRIIFVILGYYFLTLIPLYYSGVIMNPIYALCACGLDKLLLGILVGSFGFWFGAAWYYYLKEKNKGRAYFPFQKVVMPILPLIILSILFYLLTK